MHNIFPFSLSQYLANEFLKTLFCRAFHRCFGKSLSFFLVCLLEKQEQDDKAWKEVRQRR
jgi:hypothetical protein